MRDTAPQGSYKVQALDRAFAVLDLLGESDTPLGLAQVASSLQLHKSTAHRFLMVLERHRMVERTGAGKFRLGLRLFDFGNRAIEQYDLRDRAQPHLRRLVAETEETAHLCILEAARVIYIDKIEPARSVRMITRIGAATRCIAPRWERRFWLFCLRSGLRILWDACALSVSPTIRSLLPRRCARRWRRLAAVVTLWTTRSTKKGCAASQCRCWMRNACRWRR